MVVWSQFANYQQLIQGDSLQHLYYSEPEEALL
jgi:hypothetical protein